MSVMCGWVDGGVGSTGSQNCSYDLTVPEPALLQAALAMRVVTCVVVGQW